MISCKRLWFLGCSFFLLCILLLNSTPPHVSADSNTTGVTGSAPLRLNIVRDDGRFILNKYYDEFFIYVKAGEKLHFTVQRSHGFISQSGGYYGGKNFRIQIAQPNQSSYPDDCGVINNQIVETTYCRFVSATEGTYPTESGEFTANSTGIWKIRLNHHHGDIVHMNNAGDSYNWTIGVKGTDNQEKSGRVWVQELVTYQTDSNTKTNAANIEWYYVRNDGYIYKVTQLGYNGMMSTFNPSIFGISTKDANGKCHPAYRSTTGNPKIEQCGDNAKIFFSYPDPEVVPAFNEAVLGNITYTLNNSTATIPLDGTVTIPVNNFLGSLKVEMDTNGNGLYSDNEDRTEFFTIDTLNTNFSYAFDGKNSTGNIIPSGAKINVRISTAITGEMHVVNFDLERRSGGIKIERMNGQGTAEQKRTIFFDDRLLRGGSCGNWTFGTSGGAAFALPTFLGGVGGVDSNSGVHRWDTSNCTANGDNDAGVMANSSWGNNSYVEDWTYDVSAPIKTAEISVGPNLTSTKSITSASNNSSSNTDNNSTARVCPDSSNNYNNPTCSSDEYNFNYVINTINDGSIPSGPVTVTDTIDNALHINSVYYTYDGTSYSASVGGNGNGCSINGQTVSCTVNSIKVSSNAETPEFPMIVTINVTPTTAKQDIKNTAIRTGSGCNETDGCLTNETTIDAVKPNLNISKTATSDIVRVGSPFSYNVTITNANKPGSTDVQDQATAVTAGSINIKDVLDSSLANVSAVIRNANNEESGSCVVNEVTGNTKEVTCTSQQVLQPNDANSKLVVTITATPTAAIDSIPNTAYVTGGDDGKCPVGSSNTACSSTTTIKTVTPNLHIVKSMDSGVEGTTNFVVGREGKYILTITNNGTIATEGAVTVVDDVPEQFTIGTLSNTNGQGEQGSCSVTGQVVTCTRTTPIGISGVDDGSDIWIIHIPVTPTSMQENINNKAYTFGGNDQTCQDKTTASQNPRCNSDTTTNLNHAELTVRKEVKTKRLSIMKKPNPIANPEVCQAVWQDNLIGSNSINHLGSNNLSNLKNANSINNNSNSTNDNNSANDSNTDTNDPYADCFIEEDLPIILLGETANYTFTVTNTGTHATLADSYAVDYLPSLVELVRTNSNNNADSNSTSTNSGNNEDNGSDSDNNSNNFLPETCQYNAEDHAITCLIPAGLEVGESVEFTYTIRSRAVDGNIYNTVVVDGDDLDCIDQTTAREVARCNDTTTTPAFAPKLTIKKTSGSKIISRNGEVTFYLNIANYGNYETTSRYRITDQLPPELELLNVQAVETAGLDIDCNKEANLATCIMSAGLKPQEEVKIAVTAKAIVVKAGVKNFAYVLSECSSDDPDCSPEPICTSEDQRWLSGNEEYNDTLRCNSDTTIDIEELPKVPESGIFLLRDATMTLLGLCVAYYLLSKRRDSK